MPKRKIYRKTYQKGKIGRIFLLFLVVLKWLFFIFLFFIFLAFAFFVYYAKDLPRPENFTEKELFQSTKIYDRTGKIVLYEIFGEEKRTWVSLDKIPDHLKKAIIATEDANFYRHKGLDFKAIGRAILTDLKIREFTYGASTIPQQLVRSAYLSLKKTPERKIRELILALELERRYSKDQILEWYLNQIPFGRNAYGVEAASQVYFEKSVSDLSLTESATLAAFIKAPSYYSSENNFEKLLERRNYVLERMTKEGFINNQDAENSKKEPLNIVKTKYQIKAPHFVLYVKDYLIEKYGEDFLKEKGLKVYTTLDWDLQEWAEKMVLEKTEINKKHKAYNAALVALDPNTGEILTMVGSKNWFGEPEPKNCTPGKNCLFDPQTNVAIKERQPGSAFKPFVYATAFKKGYDDKTVVVDEETNFGTPENPYIPQNYDGLFRGPITLRNALAQSLNIPAVKVLRDMAGLEDSIKTAQEMGITTLTKPIYFYGLSIVLGGAEVRLLDMVSAYGVFATEGLKISPVFILKIEDANGNIIEENKKTPKRVLEPEVARLINDVLSDNNARAPMFGPRSWLYFEKYKVAAKTGTTQNFKDGWTIGYTFISPDNKIPPRLIAAGVWVGNNDNTPMKKLGEALAGPIWHAFMEKALSR